MKETITFIIAVAGFLLSLFNLGYTLWKDWFHIEVILKGYGIRPDLRSVIVKMSIENHSRQPVSISRILLKINGSIYEFESVPSPVYDWVKKQGKEVVDKISVRTITIPQKIEGLGVLGDYFYVEIERSEDQQFYDSDAQLEIYTNRGKKSFSYRKLADSSVIGDELLGK